MPSVLERITRGAGTLLTVEQDGEVVGCLEYDWVEDYLDMLRADCGERPHGGNVLYISNVVVGRPDPRILWALKRQLPKAQWIVGLTGAYVVKAPKGVPHGFYQAVIE